MTARSTYTVKCGDLLLGVRLPRKRAIDLAFAALVGACGVTGAALPGRDDIRWSLEEVDAVDTYAGGCDHPDAIRLIVKRDD